MHRKRDVMMEMEMSGIEMVGNKKINYLLQ